MKRLACCTFILSVLVACGDNRPGAGVDARPDSSMIDSMGEIDAMPDAPPTPAERIELARALPDGPASFGIVDATITYIKPVIAGATANNDPGGFTIQIDPTGPALMIEADVSTLTPAPAVGDVVSFTIGEMKTAGTNGSGLMRRGATITNYTRTTAATDIAPLVQNVTSTASLASMVGDFESELIDVTGTIAEAWGNSGNAFQRTRITTTGVTVVDPNLQLRIPTAFRDALVTSADIEIGCVVAIHRTPVNRFAAQFQVSAFNATDMTVTSCPAPTVASASATDATHVTVTFSRNIDMATVMTDGSQFTISDGTNPLAVSAAAVTGARTISLTTASQTPTTSYTVTVANTVEDVVGGALGTPSTATFAGYAIVIPTVMMASATAATTVNVTFTRNIDMASVMANGSQFTIVDDATPVPNTLAVSAASVSGMIVTLTTDAQTPGTMYTVTVLNTVTDTNGTPIGVPNTAAFLGFTPSVVNHLVINEIDYDMVGTPDNAEYVEIYNPTNATISLVGKRIVLINGDTTTAPVAYGGAGNYNLDAATSLDPGQYLVLGASTLIAGLPGTVKTLAFTGATDQLQQGPRDGVALIDVGNAGMSIAPSLIDVVFYEGHTSTNLVYDANGQNITIVPEGTATSAADSNTLAGSVCRHPNNVDTNDNSADIKFCTAATPGAANTL